MNGTFFSRVLAAPLAAILLAFCPLAASAQAFFSEIDDLPLAEGLTEAVDEGLVFENPDGRIVSAVAHGTGGVEGFARFYSATLPALGWTRQADGRYRRDDEVLTLGFTHEGRRTTVRIRVVPAAGEKGR